MLAVKSPPANAGGRCRLDPWVGKSPWRRARQPTPGSLPGESHGQRSLAGCSPWGRPGSDRTEWLGAHALDGAKALGQGRGRRFWEQQEGRRAGARWAVGGPQRPVRRGRRVSAGADVRSVSTQEPPGRAAQRTRWAEARGRGLGPPAPPAVPEEEAGVNRSLRRKGSQAATPRPSTGRLCPPGNVGQYLGHCGLSRGGRRRGWRGWGWVFWTSNKT